MKDRELLEKLAELAEVVATLAQRGHYADQIQAQRVAEWAKKKARVEVPYVG